MTVVAKVASVDLPPEIPQSSGTVASTVIDTVKVIEHAVRRAGSSASTLTPEQLDSAYDNLYLILTSMINRGVNLWCLEQSIIGLYANQGKYTLPAGTVSIVNARYRSVTKLDAVWTNLPALKSAVLTTASMVRTIGINFKVDGEFRAAFEYKNTAGAWNTLTTVALHAAAGKWFWFDIDTPVTATEYRLRETGGLGFTANEYLLSSDYSEQVMVPYNRDDYVSISNKNVAGRPLNYLYEKQIAPILTVWPVPDNTRDVLVITRQRQVQDVGSLLSKLEIPERWFECIIWMLAKNMAYELPGIQDNRIQLCSSQATEALREAELGESDGAPLRILPNISGYTR